MMEIINTWQFNVIVSLICSVLFVQYYKLAVKDSKNDGAVTILLQLIAGFSVLVLAPFSPFKFSVDYKILLLLLAACLFYALNDRLVTTARKHLEVSTYSILGMSKTFFVILIGLVFFRENFVLAKIIGAVLVVFGNGLLFYKKGKFEFNKYVVLALLAALLVSVGLSIDVGISQKFNLPIYISITFLVPALMIFIFEKQKISGVLAGASSSRKRYFAITGITWAFLTVTLIRAYQLGEFVTVSPLMLTTVLLNVIVAYFFHKEQSNIKIKITAAIIVFVGVYLTVMGK